MQATEEENHWPGYVDALTTMTMMLIFVMTILAVAIFGLSQNVSRSMVEKIAKVANIDDISSNETTDTLAARVVAKLEVQQRDTMLARAEPAQPSAPEPAAGSEHRLASTELAAPEKVQSASLAQGSAFITIAFQKRATGVDSETSDRIKAAMTAGDHLGHGVELKAFAGKEGAVSDSRRIAFYRLLNLRTRLIAMGIAPDRIKAKIEEADTRESGDLVRIDLAKAG